MPQPLKVVFLPNVRMRERRMSLIAEGGPDPRREAEDFAKNGIAFHERDLHIYPFNPLAKKGTFFAGFDPLRALKVLLFDRDADVIVSVFESNVFFILLLRKLFFFKPKVVLWEVSGRGWAKRDQVLDFVVPRADRLFLLTQDQKRIADAFYRLKAPADIVGFAIDDHFFSPLAVEGQSEPYVLAVGDDVSRDYPTLIAACRALGVPLKLRSSARLPELKENIPGITVLGRQSYRELRELYARATIVVVPIKAVDYPSGITAVFEAMAMGKPLIASRTGTTADFVQHRQNGILVTPENADELREELRSLWNDRALQATLGENGRSSLKAGFSRDHYIRRFSERLHAVASAA